MRVKILAPAATKTEFVSISSDVSADKIDYENTFKGCNTSREIAEFLGELYDSDMLLGYARTPEYTLHMTGPRIPHSCNKDKIWLLR